MTVGKGKGSRYNRRIQIERPVPDTSFDGAGSGTWEAVGTPIAASVVDVLPSRDNDETRAGGITTATRPARVRMRFRTDLDASMRFVMTKPFPRIMQITAGPAEVGVRDELEFIVEDYSSAGNAA